MYIYMCVCVCVCKVYCFFAEGCKMFVYQFLSAYVYVHICTCVCVSMYICIDVFIVVIY